MANESCDFATNAQRQFVLAQPRALPIRQDFRIFPNAPSVDPSRQIFSEIMERFRESNRDEEQDETAEVLKIELDEEDLDDIVCELITDLVEWNYDKNFSCHLCALRHLGIGAILNDGNANPSANDGIISLEAIRYASYFLKNCVGACAYRHIRNQPPQPRSKADDYEEFRLLK